MYICVYVCIRDEALRPNNIPQQVFLEEDSLQYKHIQLVSAHILRVLVLGPSVGTDTRYWHRYRCIPNMYNDMYLYVCICIFSTAPSHLFLSINTVLCFLCTCRFYWEDHSADPLLSTPQWPMGDFHVSAQPGHRPCEGGGLWWGEGEGRGERTQKVPPEGSRGQIQSMYNVAVFSVQSI